MTGFGKRKDGQAYPKSGHGKIMAWDMKAKAEAEMLDPREITMKNGMRAVKGTSALTGTKMFKILGKAC